MDIAQWRRDVGALLERARRERRLSKRAAAQKAGFSEALWRQLEDGRRLINGVEVPANPRDDTLEAAARAVGLDPQAVFDAAQRDYVPLPDEVDRPESLSTYIEDRLAAIEERLGLPIGGDPEVDKAKVEERLARVEAWLSQRQAEPNH
ncbi:MAG TPA: helix-turn-helix domain-containing protein [Propionibacteriaceae bacterium]|nr:helix-turn-helix domain-containing protein [Propionibacteriaceae bacterium]